MASEASDEDRKSPQVHNACYYPELTTFGPEITQEIRRLNCSITVQMVSFNHDMPLQIPFTVFNNSLVTFSYRRQLYDKVDVHAWFLWEIFNPCTMHGESTLAHKLFIDFIKPSNFLQSFDRPLSYLR